MLRRIRPDQVRIGMFIQSFDGAWMHHPFWRSRFLISTDTDLAKVHQAAIQAVIIDDAKGLGLKDDAVAAAAPPPALTPPAGACARTARDARPAPALRGPADDHALATQVMNRSKKVMKQVFDGARLGHAFRSEEVAAVVEEISASVLRNAHALIGVTRLKSKHEYTYLHSVAVCALMINLARELGLNEQKVRDLGMAGLLHDIGKMAVPQAILDKPGQLDDDEVAQVRDHPEEGRRLLAQSDHVPELAMEVCLHHHEKLDGTGYPHRLSGEAIGLAARMGAICDVYDALTSNRAYKQAWTPTEAVTAMASWDGHFDPALLFRFMQSIMIFPGGLLVRLRSNRLAVVLNPGRRAAVLKARAFYSTVEMRMIPPVNVTISNSFADDQIVSHERAETWDLQGWDGLRDDLLEAGRR